MAAVALAAGVASGGWNWTLQAAGAEVRQARPARGPRPRVLEAAADDTLKACAAGAGARHDRRALAALARRRLRRRAGAAAAGRARPGRATLLPAAWCCCCSRWRVFAAIDVPLQRSACTPAPEDEPPGSEAGAQGARGQPEVKGKIRARMREMASRRMLAAVPKADIVVMNPTHYAVALNYDDGDDGRAARRRQGRRPAGAAIRDIAAGSQGAGARGAAAGARAVRARRDRPRDPGRAVRRRRAGAGLGLPAARRAGRPAPRCRPSCRRSPCRPSSIRTQGADTRA